MIYDLCIVGGGMFGSAAARHASENPALRVVLVGPAEPKDSEKSKREIFGSHYDEGRITRAVEDYIACQNLGIESIKRYRELEKFSGIHFYEPVGMLAYGQQNNPSVEDLRQKLEFGKVPYLELNEKLTKERYPFLEIQPDEVGFLDENGAGYISPRKMVAAQQKVAEMQGCTIIQDVVSEVTPLKQKDAVWYHEVIREKGPAVLAKRVLICGGGFTNFKKLIPNDKNLIPDMSVIPDSAAMVVVPEEEAVRLKRLPSLLYYGSDKSKLKSMGGYVVPPIKYPDNKYYIKIGPMTTAPAIHTLEEARKWCLSNGDKEVVDSHANLLKELLPGLKVVEVKGLACITTRTPSDLPYIDRVSPTLSVAIGGNGKGAKFSDEVGRLAAELSVYGRWDSVLPQSAFRVMWTKP